MIPARIADDNVDAQHSAPGFAALRQSRAERLPQI
jgi:hypothetical protein